MGASHAAVSRSCDSGSITRDVTSFAGRDSSVCGVWLTSLSWRRILRPRGIARPSRALDATEESRMLHGTDSTRRRILGAARVAPFEPAAGSPAPELLARFDDILAADGRLGKAGPESARCPRG
jgi:hypothetical protein